MDGPIDAELLGWLLDEHGPALALYASQWTDAADDCVQEALIELAAQRQRPERVVAWLYRVVKNRALNTARGNRRRRRRETRVTADRFAAFGGSDGFDRDEITAATEALNRLEDDERELVVMRIWGGLTYEEIGAAIGVSTATAHRQYERALTKLRTLLESTCSTNKNNTKTN
jgi:RNA polymerase sigma-70 factor (ECF subfamily)